jgi:GT2 family glycosyltransferase
MSKLGPVSVVIPTWCAAAFVEKVLGYLAVQAGAEFEVLVVDNGVVSRETEEVCARFQARFASLRYLRFEKQLGYAGAVNEGSAAAAHDLVAVINNDNLPEPNWLAELVAEYEKAKREGREAIITSHVHRPNFPDPFGARLNIWGRIVRVPRSGAYIPFHPDGSALLFSRAAFGQPYDAEYFIYHEDVALGWRAWLKGYEVRLCEKSRASTFDGGSTRRIRYSTAFFTERNRWLNYFIFLSPLHLLRLLPLLWLDAALKLALGSNRFAKLHAWGWLLLHPCKILKKRRGIQAQRKRQDSEILPLLSFIYADHGIGAWLNLPLKIYAKLTRLI